MDLSKADELPSIGKVVFNLPSHPKITECNPKLLEMYYTNCKDSYNPFSDEN